MAQTFKDILLDMPKLSAGSIQAVDVFRQVVCAQAPELAVVPPSSVGALLNAVGLVVDVASGDDPFRRGASESGSASDYAALWCDAGIARLVWDLVDLPPMPTVHMAALVIAGNLPSGRQFAQEHCCHCERNLCDRDVSRGVLGSLAVRVAQAVPRLCPDCVVDALAAKFRARSGFINHAAVMSW
jgi:hypothetical protein